MIFSRYPLVYTTGMIFADKPILKKYFANTFIALQIIFIDGFNRQVARKIDKNCCKTIFLY